MSRVTESKFAAPKYRVATSAFLMPPRNGIRSRQAAIAWISGAVAAARIEERPARSPTNR